MTQDRMVISAMIFGCRKSGEKIGIKIQKFENLFSNFSPHKNYSIYFYKRQENPLQIAAAAVIMKKKRRMKLWTILNT